MFFGLEISWFWVCKSFHSGRNSHWMSIGRYGTAVGCGKLLPLLRLLSLREDCRSTGRIRFHLGWWYHWLQEFLPGVFGFLLLVGIMGSSQVLKIHAGVWWGENRDNHTWKTIKNKMKLKIKMHAGFLPVLDFCANSLWVPPCFWPQFSWVSVTSVITLKPWSRVKILIDSTENLGNLQSCKTFAWLVAFFH